MINFQQIFDRPGKPVGQVQKQMQGHMKNLGVFEAVRTKS